MKNLKSVLTVISSIAITGCAQGQMDEFNRNLNALTQTVSATPATSEVALRPAQQREKTTVTVPSDARVKDAMMAALPTIQQVLAIHQCVTSGGGMRQLNFLSSPGVDVSAASYSIFAWPNSTDYMKYHDRNSCVDIKAIDEWTMPALNALKFRVVYFAEDSGETVNFRYYFLRGSDGKWLLGDSPQCPACYSKY